MASIVTETPSVKTFRLVPEGSESSMPFTFVPGQFLNVAFSIGGARMNRSYSISSSPTERQQARYPVVYVVATLSDPEASPAESLRAWRIEDGASREVLLELR